MHKAWWMSLGFFGLLAVGCSSSGSFTEDGGQTPDVVEDSGSDPGDSADQLDVSQNTDSDGSETGDDTNVVPDDVMEDIWVAPEDIQDDGGGEEGDTDDPPEDIAEDIAEDTWVPPLDEDEDGIPDESDNCPSVFNPIQADCDEDAVGNACDEDSDSDGIAWPFDLCPCEDDPDQIDTDEDLLGDACDPDDDNDGVLDEDDDFPLDPAETADTDGDGVADSIDEDDDDDGLSDVEEMEFGEDCSITDPLNPDSDNDGVGDLVDAYPNDPFPPFITQENIKGTVTIITGDNAGGFGAPFEVGADLGGVCALEESNCNPGCLPGEYCSKGTCVVEDPSTCIVPCTGSEFCRQRLYRWISIADFDADGKMDFISNTYPPDEDGTYQLWFFNRLNETGDYPQIYLGQVDEPIYGTTADVNGDYYFDVVVFQVDKPNFIADMTATTYLGNGIDPDAVCPVGDAVNGCAFTAVEDTIEMTSIVSNQWGVPRAREAQDLDGDGKNDLVLGTYASGGNSPTLVYLLPGNGDGTFGTPTELFTHNLQGSGQGPANSMVFADFDNDTIGDVLMGFDDDGDAGSGWLYLGQESGVFSGNSTKEIDINPSCNSGCGDEVGRTSNSKGFDLNFDGAMDVLLGYYYQTVTGPPSKLVVFYGNGDGTFQGETQIGPTWPGKEAMYFQAPQRLCPWYVP